MYKGYISLNTIIVKVSMFYIYLLYYNIYIIYLSLVRNRNTSLQFFQISLFIYIPFIV